MELTAFPGDIELATPDSWTEWVTVSVLSRVGGGNDLPPRAPAICDVFPFQGGPTSAAPAGGPSISIAESGCALFR